MQFKGDVHCMERFKFFHVPMAKITVWLKKILNVERRNAFKQHAGCWKNRSCTKSPKYCSSGVDDDFLRYLFFYLAAMVVAHANTCVDVHAIIN